MKAIFLGLEDRIHYVYTAQQKALAAQKLGMESLPLVTKEELLAHPEKYSEVEWVFSTWGMPALTEEEIAEALPKLRYLMYGAGTVQPFARPFLARGVRIFSAWQANGVPVAEFTVAQILLANKGYFAACRLHSRGRRAEGVTASFSCPGSYGARVGVIAAGVIGRRVIRMLSAYHLEVVVYDPFLSEEDAAALGAKKVELPELFATCQTITNHLPNLPTTQKMLDYRLFSAMLPTATFINTGRGAQLVEADLVRALQEVPTRTALIDVTDPEVLPEDHIFYTMDNVFLSPHIAGSQNDEAHRLSAYMLEETDRLLAGEKPLYEVTLPMLKTMA